MHPVAQVLGEVVCLMHLSYGVESSQGTAIVHNILGAHGTYSWYLHQFGGICRIEVDKFAWFIFAFHILRIGMFSSYGVEGLSRIRLLHDRAFSCGCDDVGLRMGKVSFALFLWLFI